jgi:hypothetical protein
MHNECSNDSGLTRHVLAPAFIKLWVVSREFSTQISESENRGGENIFCLYILKSENVIKADNILKMWLFPQTLGLRRILGTSCISGCLWVEGTSNTTNLLLKLILLCTCTCNWGTASYIIWWWHIPYRQWPVYKILNINIQHRFGQITTVYFMPSDNQFTIIMREWAVQTWINDYMQNCKTVGLQIHSNLLHRE